MTAVLLIFLLSVAGMLALVLFKPAVHIGNVPISIFYVPPVIGAFLLVLTGFLSWHEVGAGLAADTAVNPLKILILFFSMTLLSVFLDEAGFFRYLAASALGHAKTSQRALFLLLMLSVSVLTVFTSNDIVILTFTPFICYFSKHAEIDPVPYLIGEFVAANTWSMALIIGNPTNIYLAAGNGISFFAYFRVMWLPTLLSGVISFLVLAFLFRKKLAVPMKCGTPPHALDDKPTVVLGVVILALCIVFLSFSSFLGLPMWIVSAVSCAVLYTAAAAELALRGKGLRLIRRSVLRIPLDTAPFVLSMFVLVLALERAGFTGALSKLLGGEGAVFRYGVASFLAANLVNNIPMSVLFSFVTAGQGPGALYASVIGSNIGAFLTPVGALAGIMWMAILQDHGVKLSFGRFVLFGVAVSLPALTAALFGLWLVI